MMMWERFQRGSLFDVFGAGSAVGGVAQAAGTVAAAGINAGAITSAAGTQADAAKYGADKSYQAANDANALQKSQFDTQQKNIAPWLAAGKQGLGAIGTGVKPGGAYDATYNQTFNAPTASGANPTAFSGNPNFKFDATDLQNDPGYQFQLNAGNEALTRAQAAQGVTGGAALKEIDRYNQDYAGTAYNTAYQRAQGTFEGNYSRAAGQQQQTFANTEEQAANQFSRAQSEYGTQYNQFENDRNTNFNRQATLAGIGQTATQQLGAAGSNYANQAGANLMYAGAAAGNYATQGANASAAGSIAQGNNIGSALSQLGRNFTVPGQYVNGNQTGPYTPPPSGAPISASQWASYDQGSTPGGFRSYDANGNLV